MCEHAVERARHATEVERLHERRCQSDLPVVQEAPQLILDHAAAVRGLNPGAIIKTIVVRRAEDDYLFVLVPGDREISWPKLRELLGVNRISMPDKDIAKDVTGYERGTITPFGSTHAWPVVADALLAQREGPVSIGAGAHGLAATVAPEQLIEVLGAQIADVTEPLTAR